ncbi:MAG: hypothetical protein PUH25_10120 [Spirochaetales bacterium]|nr:hypothetical protein [Spirochaetales bacterium]
MNEELFKALTDKDDKKAYEVSKEIIAISSESSEYYLDFETFYSLINQKSSFQRARGFILCCSLARHDSEGKLARVFPIMLKLLNDDKPTVVRQCLNALHEVVLYRPELSDEIKEALKGIDLSKYKDSMTPLIEKDIKSLESILI